MISVSKLRQETGRAATAALGAVRRMAVTLTSSVLWQLTGFDLGDGNAETINAETFSGVGFYARPPTSGKPEAIAVMVGGAKAPVIVAVRDEATRSQVAAGIEGDEAMMFGSQAIVYVKNNGTVEIRTPGGSAFELALKSDVASTVSTLNALITAYFIHVHGGVTTGGGVSAVPTVVTAATAPAPTGTSVLKGA